MTALLVAVLNGHESVSYLLVDHGADWSSVSKVMPIVVWYFETFSISLTIYFSLDTRTEEPLFVKRQAEATGVWLISFFLRKSLQLKAR